MPATVIAERIGWEHSIRVGRTGGISEVRTEVSPRLGPQPRADARKGS